MHNVKMIKEPDDHKYGTKSAIWSVAISDNGQYMVATSGYPDLSISLFNKNAELLWRHQTGGLSKCAAISENGEYIVTGIYARKGTGNVLFYNNKGRLLWRYQTRKKIESVAMSKNNENIAVSSRDGTIYLFKKEGKLLWSRKTRSWNERVIVFISNGIVIAISHQGSFYFYDLKGKLLRRHETQNIIGSAAMCGTDYVLTGYGDKTLFMIEKNGELAWKNQLNSTPYSIAASKSGNHIVIGLEDGRVLLSNRKGELLWEYMINGSVNSVTVSTEGERIVAGSNDFNLSVLAKSGNLLWNYKIGDGIIQKISDENSALEAIVQAQSVIADVKLMKINVSDAEKLLEQAKEYEKNTEYENAIVKAEEARKIASIKKEEYIKARAADTISLASIFIKDAKKSGFDVSDALKKLKQAGTQFKQKEYENARSNAMKAREIVKELTEKAQVKIALITISRAEAIIREVKKYKIDIKEPEKHLQCAKKEEKKGAYNKAIEFALKAEKKAKSIKNRYLKGKILEIIISAQHIINELKVDGIDVDDIEKVISLANKEIEKGNYKKAEKTALRAKERAKELKLMSARERAANIIVKARNISIEAKNLGAEIKETEKLLESAEKSMEEGFYEKAIDFANKAISLSEELKYSFLSEDVKQAIISARNTIKAVKEIGANVSEAQHLIREAEILYENKEYGKSMGFAKKSEESAIKAKEKYLAKGALDIVKKAQYLVAELKKRSIFVTEAEELLQRSIVNLQNQEHKKAVEFARNSIRSSRKSEKEYNNAINAINETKSVIKQAKETNIDVRESETILNEAVELLKIGRYKDSFVKANLAKKNVIKAQGYYANTLKIINSVKEIVLKFKKLGINVSEAEKLLTDAFSALKSGIYQKAVSYANSAKKTAEEAGREHSQTLAIINEARATIEEVKHIGINVKSAENLLNNSVSYFKNGDYINASNFAKKAQTAAKYLEREHRDILNKINACKAQVMQIKGFGVNVTKAEKMIIEAMDIIKTSHDNALQMANNAVISAKNSFKKHKETSKIIDEKKNSVFKIKNTGVNVFEAEELLGKAKTELINGEFKEAIKYAEKALNSAQMAQHRSIGENAKTLIEKAISLIQQAEELGANTSKAKVLIKKAQFSFGTENYKDAIITAKQSKEEAQNSILNLEKAKELVKKGLLFHNNNRFNDAVLCFDEAISLHPYFETFYFKAESLEKLGRYRKGIECCDKILIHEPNYENALYLKGIFLNHLKRFKEAIPFFSSALGINPKMELGWYNKGVALDEVGEHEEAVSCYKKALQLKSFPEAWYNLGVATYHCKRYEEAIEYYDKALRIRDEYEDAWYNKGEALRELKMFQEALFCFENSLEINPYNEKAIKERENCFMERKFQSQKP